ncbi:hypothetical protein CDN99_11955 [Roseateles aquatilis]|uniref:Uncharacterized protein n=1 Tax=Roseateles aquatilis TaxID=431061 RepID=A0A246JE44_9BURK|nr:hypothetical protein [Roseateles aquatilis]OWQ90868.1 hypothetical protein CDN99_11955 [Roseateles aquatilis]
MHSIQMMVAYGPRMNRPLLIQAEWDPEASVGVATSDGRRFPMDHTIKSRFMANAVLRQAGLDQRF